MSRMRLLRPSKRRLDNPVGSRRGCRRGGGGSCARAPRAAARHLRSAQPPPESIAASPQPANADEGSELAIFGWDLLVPEDSRRSDDDLLRRAVKLATRDDLRDKRLAFHEWRRKLQARGVSDDDALADSERRLDAYREVTRRLGGKKRAVNVFTVGGITVSAVGTLVVPPAVAAAPFIATARFAADQWLPSRAPGKETAAVAMFYRKGGVNSIQATMNTIGSRISGSSAMRVLTVCTPHSRP